MPDRKAPSVETPSEQTSETWKHIPWRKLEQHCFRIQKRIFRASQQGNQRAVHKLQKLLMKSEAARTLAVRRVTQDNQGKKTAGIDGQTALHAHQRLTLVRQIHPRHWPKKASPVRRMYIPKPGKEEKRPLGIPTIAERARQMLVKLALEPEWEAKFEANSYGFRPGRSCHDAIEAIFKSIVRKPKYVLDADIAGCFDHINHDALVQKLSSYPRLTQAVKAWLRAGALDGNVFVETTSGTPQGGVISPLLANIALHGMETAITQAYPSDQQPHVVRYADDFVVLHPTEEGVQKAQARAAAWLADMGLEMKASKTRIAHTLYPINGQAGFNFLGFTIRQFPMGKSQTGKDGHGKPLGFKTLIKPSQEKVKEHLRALGRTVHALKAASQEQVIGALNPQIVGWSHYYRTVVAKETFDDCDSTLYHILRSWARRRHPNKNMHWIMGKYWAVDNHEGWKFKAATGYVLKRHTATPITRHIKVRGKASPYDGNLIYWAQRLRAHPLMHSTVGKLLYAQHGQCAWCGLYFRDGDLLEIDHIRPSSQGGKNEWHNLRVIHRHCHDQRHCTYEKGHATEELDESKDSCPVLKTSAGGDSCV